MCIQPSPDACCWAWKSDPEPEITGWQPNTRGVSYVFGNDVIEKFLGDFDLDLVCRAHQVGSGQATSSCPRSLLTILICDQVVEDGYKFTGNRTLVTIFSAPNYCGQFDNAAAMLMVNPDLMCSFRTLPASAAVSHRPT